MQIIINFSNYYNAKNNTKNYHKLKYYNSPKYYMTLPGPPHTFLTITSWRYGLRFDLNLPCRIIHRMMRPFVPPEGCGYCRYCSRGRGGGWPYHRGKGRGGQRINWCRSENCDNLFLVVIKVPWGCKI